MRRKKKNIEHKKYQRVFEYEDCTVIWKYDTHKAITGPYEVETKYFKKKP
jgi:hypothetical protein